ncbi:MAG: ribbon-helix-helix protein, CopG family [Actinomycetota bacterium]
MNRILVQLPDTYTKALDTQAKRESRSRSDIVRELVRDHIRHIQEEKARQQRREAAFRDMDELRAKTKGSGFSGSDFIREWRYREAK